MAVGFAFFILFVYKASHEIASPKIAAGVQHIQAVNDSGDSLPVFSSPTPNYNTAALLAPNTIALDHDDTPLPTTNSSSISGNPHLDNANKQPKADAKIKVAKHVALSRSDSLKD